MRERKTVADWSNTDWRVFAFIIALAIGIVSIPSCSTLGYENVDTTHKPIVVANAEIRAANLLLQDLIRRDAITDDAARSALNTLRTAHGHLQTALDALALSNDPAAAQTALERANVALSLSITLLSTFTGEPGP